MLLYNDFIFQHNARPSIFIQLRICTSRTKISVQNSRSKHYAIFYTVIVNSVRSHKAPTTGRINHNASLFQKHGSSGLAILGKITDRFVPVRSNFNNARIDPNKSRSFVTVQLLNKAR